MKQASLLRSSSAAQIQHIITVITGKLVQLMTLVDGSLRIDAVSWRTRAVGSVVARQTHATRVSRRAVHTGVAAHSRVSGWSRSSLHSGSTVVSTRSWSSLHTRSSGLSGCSRLASAALAVAASLAWTTWTTRRSWEALVAGRSRWTRLAILSALTRKAGTSWWSRATDWSERSWRSRRSSGALHASGRMRWAGDRGVYLNEGS